MWLTEDGLWTTVALGVLTLWMLLVAYLRRSRAQYLAACCRAALEKREAINIGNLGGKGYSTEHEPALGTVPVNGVYGSTWRVHNLITACELKFEAWLAMSARGLFLTYGIPSISAVLHKTGGFDTDTKRRYADMELLIREFNENAPDGCLHFDGQPDRARRAIERLNAIHDKYGATILYRDMMYVLAVFMTTPYILMTSWWLSWRGLTADEKECIYWHWVDIGSMMGLRVTDNFKSLDDVVAYKYAFERKHMRKVDSNVIVGHSTIDFFVKGCVWAPLRPLARPLILCAMAAMQENRQQAAALGLPVMGASVVGVLLYPPVALLLHVLFWTKAVFTRLLLPPLSLRKIDRLTGRRPVNASSSSYDDRDMSENSNNGLSDSTSRVERKSSCPFAFRPVRPLDFNNSTYLPHPPNGDNERGQSAYVIEHMGPRHIPAGETTKTPRYRGMKEGKVI
jgi:hypothetical protein